MNSSTVFDCELIQVALNSVIIGAFVLNNLVVGKKKRTKSIFFHKPRLSNGKKLKAKSPRPYFKLQLQFKKMLKS